MLSIDKLLSLAGVGSTIANISLLKRFLSAMAVIIALTAISSTILGVFVIAGLYLLYLSLVHHGLEPVSAALMISGCGLVIVIVLSTLAVMRWYQLREMPRLLDMEQPIIERVSKVADSFISGLLAERTPRR